MMRLKNQRRQARDLTGATVVITGASSGIGEAAALAFAAAGSRLVLAARDEQAVEAVAAQCRAMGAQAMSIAADVTDLASVQALADEASAFGDGIDVWFSNVGIGAVGLYHETPMEAHEQVVRANLIGHMNDAYAALPIFLRQGRGTFINMISLGGFAAAPWAVAYSASKFGLRGFSEALRGELRRYPDIHICDVYPSFADTPGLRHGANYTGRRISTPPPVLDPVRIAMAVVDLARRPRPGVTIGAPAHGVRMLSALAPKLTAALGASFLGVYFRHARQTPLTHGNLFEPPLIPGGVHGGFAPVNRKAALALGVGLAAVGVAVLGVRARTGRAASA